MAAGHRTWSRANRSAASQRGLRIVRPPSPGVRAVHREYLVPAPVRVRTQPNSVVLSYAGRLSVEDTRLSVPA
eukprot:scaffold30357_cov116-Isochrysis_galbana.AAC.7